MKNKNIKVQTRHTYSGFIDPFYRPFMKLNDKFEYINRCINNWEEITVSELKELSKSRRYIGLRSFEE